MPIRNLGDPNREPGQITATPIQTLNRLAIRAYAAASSTLKGSGSAARGKGRRRG